MAGRSLAVAVLILCSILVSCNAAGHGRGRGGGRAPDYGTMFNVMSYGAKPGTKQESTMAFIRAWKAACDFNGKATLVIPPGVYKLGETVFQGPCKGPRPITVLLQGTVQAVSDPSSYTGKGWISFDGVDGLELTGGGTIDGQGQAVWQYNDCKSNSDCVHLPASLYIVKVKNAKIKGIKLINPMGFHMHITLSYEVRLYRLKITAPADSPNTDGMHISQSNTVKVSRTLIGTGDDCVSLGQGATNVTINQVTCGPGHGISVGSLGKYPKELDVRGVIVKNCTLKETTNGLRIKTYAGSDPSNAAGILFRDIIMENVKNPIVIDQHYGSNSAKPSQVKISDVIYMDIKGTTTSPQPVNLMCSSQVPCQNLKLRTIDLQTTGAEKPVSVCENAVVGYAGVQNPPPCVSGH